MRRPALAAAMGTTAPIATTTAVVMKKSPSKSSSGTANVTAASILSAGVRYQSVSPDGKRGDTAALLLNGPNHTMLLHPTRTVVQPAVNLLLR
uniref:Putative secreted protein n=1 Tax=Anopheles darlingi TaxID=43151 RepID=A0A2M4DQL9_ANODA